MVVQPLFLKAATGPYIKSMTVGKIIDMGIKDANNMGAAMAPAALDTLVSHFNDTDTKPSYYDAIFTGDLGYIGKDILSDLATSKGYNINNNYNDCGVMIFDKEVQDTHAGRKWMCMCCNCFFGIYI